MRLAHRLFSHDREGGELRHPRRYEVAVTLAFGGFRRRVFDRLVTLSGAAPGNRVLDVGCGTGYLTRRVARAVGSDGEVVGIDPSEPMIRYARGRSPSWCRFRVAIAQAVPEPDASFDVVVTSFALHHVPADEHADAFRELYRVLRPGGRLLIADFRPARFTGHRAAADTRHRPPDNTGHQPADDTLERVAALVTGAGFRVLETGTGRPYLYYLRAVRADRR